MSPLPMFIPNMLFIAGFFLTVASGRVISNVDAVPEGWSKLRSPAATDLVRLQIALRPEHGPARLGDVVMGISTPGHENYGKHLSASEVQYYTAPAKDTKTAVSSWLATYSLEETKISHDTITILAQTFVANELLNTTFDWYKSQAGNKILRTLQYSVPEALVDSINMIQPTTYFGSPGHRDLKKSISMSGFQNRPNIARSIKTSSPLPASCNISNVTPPCIRDLYEIKYTPPAGSTPMAFASFLGQVATQSDLDIFLKEYAPDAVGGKFTNVLFGNATDVQTSEVGEAAADVEIIIGISHPLPVIQYVTPGLGPVTYPEYYGDVEPWLDYLTYMANVSDSDLPTTISYSYEDSELIVPQDYALKVCDGFLTLAARGVSNLFSSGDGGPGDYCYWDSGDKTPTFQAMFPSSCPWNTAVGFTDIYSGYEKATNYSGCGCSRYFDRPSYQNDSVNEFISKYGDNYGTLINKTARLTPDVVALGGIPIASIFNGSETYTGYSSASAPIFASVIGMLNAARQSIDLPVLGFLNPWLYQNPQIFNDIVDGYVGGCEYYPGYIMLNATKGWDIATGLGSPNFPAMLALAAPGVANT